MAKAIPLLQHTQLKSHPPPTPEQILAAEQFKKDGGGREDDGDWSDISSAQLNEADLQELEEEFDAEAVD